MENIIKKPYEISLWDEILVFEVECFDEEDNSLGTITKEQSLESFEPIEGTSYTEIVQYYKERKICIIGSDTMHTPVRAVNPKLVSNVNGSNTLTFSLYSKYWDEEEEEFFDNPFLKLLVNERKIKLRYGAIGMTDCKWYDLIIKNVQENSESKTFNYTAKDQFVNELSKSGFDLVLDAELENNMGNITTLAETILDGSDWKLGENNDTLTQTREEPLYEIILKDSITVKDMRSEATLVIEANETIYGFYNVVTNQESYFQLLYSEDGYEVDDDHVITNSKNWFIDGVSYSAEGLPSFAKSMTMSKDYRGDRLVRQVQTRYDATIDKYVYVYKDANGNEYYGYTESEYLSPSAVLNFVTAPEAYTSFSGWEVGGATGEDGTVYPLLQLQGYPDMRDVPQSEIADKTYISFLKYQAEKEGQTLFNSGVMDYRSQINGFAENDEFVFRIKYATATENSYGRPETITYQTTMPNVKIGQYQLKDGIYTFIENGVLFDSQGATTVQDGDYVYIRFKCARAMPYSEMIREKIGIFIELPINTAYYIEDVQFFRYVTYEKEILDENNEGTGQFETLMAVPGGELVASIKTKYYYYIPNENYESIEDVSFIYDGYEPLINLDQVYNDNQYEKIRSITAKESNRFNLIQTLCETFECWAKFEIEHDMATGEILLDKEDGYRQKKWITFHEYIGNDNYAGFKYGINLKSIQRTIESDGIVSKLVVKNNANQFAENGFCSIARAQENPTGENFIYDFSYYIQQGLLGFSEVNNDLYLDINGYLGYYKKLRALNRDREAWIEEQAGLLTDRSEYEASYQTYKISVESAEEELRATEIEIKDLTGSEYLVLVEVYNQLKDTDEETWTEDQTSIMNWWEDDELIVKVNKLAQLKNIITHHIELRDKALAYLTTAETRYDELVESIENLATEKRILNLQFYKKYSRFIQEGSWIKEDYIDDNLYYLDAESTLRTSAHPKITYNISVLELSQLEGYENYKFNLGDKTYMEDTEFFGWVWKDGIKTPYHEEIVVTELTIMLDSPEQNTAKVQNYKTQFEDLFQRITATTQSVEYHTGEYTRAAGIVESDGTIATATLQNSISNNAIRLENAKDQSVVWDETGITTTSLAKPNEVVRIISGGIFLSTDGGSTWNTGLTGSGINANYITTGQLNTGVINIMNGNFPSFRWDGKGLSAYQFLVDKTTQTAYGFNNAKFVRFDQYGIYGINGISDFDPNLEENERVGEDKIWDKANFALTWKGFLLKNKYGNGYVSISSTDDILVSDGINQRIKIGNLGDENNPIYGIRIANAEGAPVMETDDSGELWLKNRLHIGTGETSTVEIGYLDAVRADTDIHEVIHAGDGDQEFIVYEDGKMVAQGAEFHGAIYATGGKIGNLTIGNVEDAVANMDSIAEATRKLDISSKLGYNFKVEGGVSSPAALELIATPTAFTVNANGISWFGSNNFESWDRLASDTDTYNLTYESFKEVQLNSTYYIKAVATATDGTSYEDWTTIMSISDGEKGEDAITLVITSSNGNYFRNNVGTTTLTARLFQSGVEIDAYQPYSFNYHWYDMESPNVTISTEKTLTITADQVNFNKTYACDVSYKEE